MVIEQQCSTETFWVTHTSNSFPKRGKREYKYKHSILPCILACCSFLFLDFAAVPGRSCVTFPLCIHVDKLKKTSNLQKQAQLLEGK